MKKFYIAMMAMLLSGSAIAAPVDATSAKEKAAAFLKKQAQHSTNSRRAAALRNPQLNEAQAFGNALHVFNVGQDNGFVIVSGDDRTDEILGYVDEGTFDINQAPANMKAWLLAVEEQIRIGKNLQKAPRRTNRENIPALMASKWDQWNNYSTYLFDDLSDPLKAKWNGGSIATGCVATAMAMVAYYDAKRHHEETGSWPDVQTRAVPGYTVGAGDMEGVVLPELPVTTFDWESMNDDISSSSGNATEEAVHAVDKLMMYCGRAMEMDYDSQSSGAYFYIMPRGLYLIGMNPYVQNLDRAYFTTQEWEDVLYNELAHKRAVAYTGITPDGTSANEGHAYVCDGYQDGLWHINWGWSGQFNGFFDLAILQPSQGSTQTVAGGVPTYHYNLSQQMTINCTFDTPEDVNPSVCFTYINGRGEYKETYNYSSGTYKHHVKYYVYNLYGGDIDIDLGWAIQNGNSLNFLGEDANNLTLHRMSIGMKDGDFGTTQERDFDDLTFPGDGVYDVVPVSRIHGTEEWYPCKGADKMYFTITVENNSITNVIAHPQAPSTNNMSATFDFEGDMEANQDNIVHVNVSNLGDDFWGTVRLYYSTSSSSSLPSTYIEQLASIKPNESTVDFTVNLPKGEYKIWFLVNPSGYLSASSAISTGKMFIGYGADANKVQEGNLQFDGQEGAATLNVKSVNGQLAPVTGTFEVTNSSSNPYTNTYYIAVEKGSTTYATATVAAEVAANSTETISFDLGTVTGLSSGTTYTVRLYKKNGDSEVNVATKDLTLQPYFRYWLADGTEKEFAETSYSNQLSGDGLQAIAIDCRGISMSATMYMDGVTNPNCIFYIEKAQLPTSSYYSTYGRNLVIDGVAESMTINANYPFFAPEAFTAEEISFSKTFENGIVKDGNPYWYTIVLPFEVNSVKQGTKNLKWFKSATDKRCHFWLMELTDVAANTLTFDYAQKFEANTPYIIQVPSTGWGDSWNLARKELTFRGLNVTVPATEFAADAVFVGTYAPLTTSGLFLDATENKFVFSENGTVAPYNAYINAPNNANAMRIVIAGDEIATGIGQVTIDNDQDLYDLQGRRVQHAQKGLYIQNGKVVVIK